jgi:hypothetical protein
MIASTEAIHERYEKEIQRLERRLDEEHARFDKLLADMRADRVEILREGAEADFDVGGADGFHE